MVKNSIDPSRVSSDARHVTAQYSAIIFCRSVKFALSVIRSLACCRNLADPKRAGPNALKKSGIRQPTSWKKRITCVH